MKTLKIPTRHIVEYTDFYITTAMINRLVKNKITLKSFMEQEAIKIEINNTVLKCIITSITMSKCHKLLSIVELTSIEPKRIDIKIYVFHYARVMDAYYNPSGFELQRDLYSY